jgi:hypothetical protein
MVAPELDDPCNLDLAPDYKHKANISGGSPYGIELPCLGADPIFVHDEHSFPLVDYLRFAFTHRCMLALFYEQIAALTGSHKVLGSVGQHWNLRCFPFILDHSAIHYERETP